eukprot:m.144934 g.144934  ORF g.144934 m.144934 type:complete len:349 (-) comp16776_c3_seq5:949-1995(-)
MREHHADVLAEVDVAPLGRHEAQMNGIAQNVPLASCRGRPRAARALVDHLDIGALPQKRLGLGRHVGEIVPDDKDLDAGALRVGEDDLHEAGLRHAVAAGRAGLGERLIKIDDADIGRRHGLAWQVVEGGEERQLDVARAHAGAARANVDHEPFDRAGRRIEHPPSEQRLLVRAEELGRARGAAADGGAAGRVAAPGASPRRHVCRRHHRVLPRGRFPLGRRGAGHRVEEGQLAQAGAAARAHDGGRDDAAAGREGAAHSPAGRRDGDGRRPRRRLAQAAKRMLKGLHDGGAQGDRADGRAAGRELREALQSCHLICTRCTNRTNRTRSTRSTRHHGSRRQRPRQDLL